MALRICAPAPAIFPVAAPGLFATGQQPPLLRSQSRTCIRGTIAVILTNDLASIFTQRLSVGIVGGFVLVTSAAAWAVLDMAIGLRVDEETKVNGLDMAEPGMKACPDFSRG